MQKFALPPGITTKSDFVFAQPRPVSDLGIPTTLAEGILVGRAALATSFSSPGLVDHERRVRAQDLTGLGDHALDDPRSRRRVSNYSGNLAHEYAGVIGVSRLERTPESLKLDVDNLLHLLLAPMPLGNKAVVQDPNHEFRVGPVALPGHIDRPRLHRGIAVGTDDRLTKTFRRFGLFARDETRPD